MKKHLINSNKKTGEQISDDDYFKHILPKFEKYPHHDKGLLMCFTVNPKEQYFGDIDRLRKIREDTTKFLSSYYAKYELYVELSPTSRIHYHGYIKIYDYFKWLYSDFPEFKDHCTVALKNTLDKDANVDIWDTYISKQQTFHHLKPIFIRRLNSAVDGIETKSYLANSSKGLFMKGCQSEI